MFETFGLTHCPGVIAPASIQLCVLSLTFNAFWKNHGHTYVRAGKISASMVAHLAVGWRPLPTLQLQGGLWDVCNHCVKKGGELLQ